MGQKTVGMWVKFQRQVHHEETRLASRPYYRFPPNIGGAFYLRARSHFYRALSPDIAGGMPQVLGVALSFVFRERE